MEPRFGWLSTLAYAAVATWAFWRLMTEALRSGVDVAVPPLALFAMMLIAAKTFAMIIHWRCS